ncbi:aldo/keto reductase [Streptomyces sp. NPDC059862]|uniref:aldo/keto reductase n=1 Tax=unclassified Streptomyces TaxID=2593676 RepID=UPI003645A0B3
MCGSGAVHDPRWQPGNFGKNVEAVDRLADLAAAKGITVSPLALAWLLTRGGHIVPIPGAVWPGAWVGRALPDVGGAAIRVDRMLPPFSVGCARRQPPFW